MNKRQYKKYTKICFGFVVLTGDKLVKKRKYCYKRMHERYLLNNRLKKYRNGLNIRCFLEECAGCNNIIKF